MIAVAASITFIFIYLGLFRLFQRSRYADHAQAIAFVLAAVLMVAGGLLVHEILDNPRPDEHFMFDAND